MRTSGELRGLLGIKFCPPKITFFCQKSEKLEFFGEIWRQKNGVFIGFKKNNKKSKKLNY
jgi:hypothetical protein